VRRKFSYTNRVKTRDLDSKTDKIFLNFSISSLIQGNSIFAAISNVTFRKVTENESNNLKKQQIKSFADLGWNDLRGKIVKRTVRRNISNQWNR
jgi:hypothetical protein